MRRTIILLVLLLFLTFCTETKREVFKKIFYRMDTVVELTIVKERDVSLIPFWSGKKSEVSAEREFNRVDSFLADFESRFSQNSSSSELLRLNNRKTKDTVKISIELAEMLALGKIYGDTLNGEFDITILPLKNLWGFGSGEEKSTKPSKDIINEVLEKVNYKNYKVLNDSFVVFTDSNTLIDCGGIAKGVAIRKIGELLDLMEIKDYLISAGGDILAKGKRIDNTPWKLGIKHPRHSDSPLAIFPLMNASVVTSGDYERYVVYEDERYHHIFDVKTGYPSKRNMSVTIKAPDPVIADILSTGLFSRKAEDIISFVERRKGYEAVVVDSAGKVWVSKGWEKDLRLF